VSHDRVRWNSRPDPSPLARHHRPVEQAPLVAAVIGGIDGDAERLIIQLFRQRQALQKPAVVVAHIDLKHRRGVAGGPHLLQIGLGNRADKSQYAKSASRLDRRQCAARVHLGDAADGGQEYGKPVIDTKERCGHVDIVYLAQYARPECQGIQGLTVAEHRHFAFRAADQKCQSILIQSVITKFDNLAQGMNFGKVPINRHGSVSLIVWRPGWHIGPGVG
jgi:hypothetical protein